MSLLKDIIIETVRRMPENSTYEDITYEILDIGSIFKDFSEEDFLKFHNLTKKWKEETLLTSSVNKIESNPSYLEIIGMGKKVLPYIFQDLKYESAFWFSALEKITVCNPIEPHHRGIVKLMTEDWLKWGKEHGYICSYITMETEQ